MRLSIRDPRAHELARELVQASGETMTKAVIVALAERLDRVRPRGAGRGHRAARIMAHGKAFAELPVVDPRSPDEIVGYDQVGLPR